MVVSYLDMDLPGQRICSDIDLVNLAVPIQLAPGKGVLIMWAFTPTNRSNFLFLSIIDDNGTPNHYRVATWQDTNVQYRLQNTTNNPQSWFLTGWEVSAYDGGSGECPKSQDGLRLVNGKAQFFSRTPYYGGAGVHPGDTLVTVEVL